MTYSNTKRKINHIDLKQNQINTQTKNNRNTVLTEKAINSFQPPKVIYETDYQTFSTDRVLGSTTSTQDPLAIQGTISFSDEISMITDMIPNIQTKILIKKPTIGELAELVQLDIYGYDSGDVVQTNTFKDDIDVFQDVGFGLVFLGKTQSFGDTNATGDSVVTLTTPELTIIKQQVNVELTEDNSVFLTWNKLSNTHYSFSTTRQIMFVVPAEENVGTTNNEGDRVFTAVLFESGPNEGEIDYYLYEDQRETVNYPAYRPITYDIEAKLIMSIVPNNNFTSFDKYEITKTTQ